MKRLLFITVLLSLSGCGDAVSTPAGAKWAKVLQDPDVKTRKKAAFTLGNLGPSDPAVMPALLGALKDPAAEVRRESIVALVKCGADAKTALPVLAILRQTDRDLKVRDYAARAISKLQDG